MEVTDRARLSSPLLVGREPESGRFAAAVAALVAGRPRVVVISGEAGIGKTRLIDDGLRRVDAPLRVLRGECLALGSAIPYLPFAALLRDLVRQVPSHVLGGILGSARRELARLLPELAPTADLRADAVGPGLGEAGDLDRLRLFEAFLRVAERVAAEQPSVFVLEDVQWIDVASLELLSFLAHGLRQRNQAMVVVSVRPDDLEGRSGVLTLLADLGRDSATDRIELAPLSVEGTRELVTAILGEAPSDPIVERIHARSDGNPLFVEELLAAPLDPSPESPVPTKLRDLVAVRLARVPADALAVLRVAAVAGRMVDDRLLSTVSGLSQGQVRNAVHAALDAHILTRSLAPAGYRFRHEIIRSLVAAQLLPDETQRLHAAYAEALATAPADQRNATEIASHWDAAGEESQALAAHVAAAQAAKATFAYDEACRHSLRALELWDRVPEAATVTGAPHAAIVAAAAAATAKAGDLPGAIALTRQLIAELGEDDTDVRELARSSLRWYLWEAGDLELALAETDATPDVAPPRWRANALAHRAGILLYLRRTPAAAQTAREALAVADSADATEEHILAEGVLGWCLLLEGEIESGLASIRRALDAAVATEGTRPHDRYPVGPVLAHAQLATALELVGRFEELRDTALAGAAVAARQGLARTYGSLLRAAAARALYQVGRWDEATATLDEALRDGAVSAGRVALLAVRALLAVGRGEQRVVERSLADAERLADGLLPIDVRRWLTVAQAEDALWRGDPLEALTRISRLAGDAGDRPGVGLGGPPAVLDASIPPLLVLGARACAELAVRERASDEEPGLSVLAAGQVEASLRRVRRQPALASAWAGDLAVARAELARTAPDAIARERRWKAAADLLTARPYASAYARWRLAEAHLARREGRREAAAAIAQGLAIAERLNARPLANELRELAQRARLGVGPGPDAPVTVSFDAERRPFGLTAREAEVLVLLTEGLSNGEIAQRLFISPKTASVHVSNIYAKLGVETRVAAASMARSMELGAQEAPPAKGRR